MPTFIDESGDTGWYNEPKRQSAHFFRLAAVWLPDPKTADACREAIRSLHLALPVPSSFLEFKYSWTEQRPEWRQRFLQTTLDFRFRFAIATFDKLAIWNRRPKPEHIHYPCARALAATLRRRYALAESAIEVRPGKKVRLNEEVVVDDNQDSAFLAAVTNAFYPLGIYPCGTRTPTRFLGAKPRFADSEKEELLQLADMICGAAGDYLQGRNRWFEIIRDRCDGIEQHP